MTMNDIPETATQCRPTNEELGAEACSPFEAGHVTMPVMIDGRRATITADPDMPEATLNALMSMVKCAFAAMERGDFDAKANTKISNG